MFMRHRKATFEKSNMTIIYEALQKKKKEESNLTDDAPGAVRILEGVERLLEGSGRRRHMSDHRRARVAPQRVLSVFPD